MKKTNSAIPKVKTVDLDRLREATNKAFAENGIILTGKPLSHEELMKLMIAEGVDPEKNIASRDIIRARHCGED